MSPVLPGSDLTEPPSHIGPAKPVQTVRVRKGRFNRAYSPWDAGSFPVGAEVADSDPNTPWQATWTPLSAWITLPNDLQVDFTQNFDQKGIRSATIQIENIMYPGEASVGGGAQYHLRKRGYLSPLRGFVGAGLTALTDEDGTAVIENEWFDLLREETQIDVWQGYGSELSRWTGLIDDADMESHPDRITITARDFGQVLSDERIFGWNKDPAIHDPVVFIDREEASSVTHDIYDAVASSSSGSNTPDQATDGDNSTYWESDVHTIFDYTEYIEGNVHEGIFEHYYLSAGFDGAVDDGMELYVSVYAKSHADGSPPTRGGAALTPDAWVDLGLGTVPGVNGGVPYIIHDTGVSLSGLKRTLSAAYSLGAGSKIRLSFRSLDPTSGAGTHFAAGVREFFGYREQISAEAAKKKWVLVDDISDVVKVILRWAGFKEWEIESAGTRLPKRMIFQRGDFYMDGITQVSDGIGYLFYMKAPTQDDRSIGVPVWRYPRVASPTQQPIVEVNDRMMLNNIQIKASDEPLAYIIRVRGRDKNNGNRLLYVFRPPWGGTAAADYQDSRLAGVIKHVMHQDNLFTKLDDCRFGAYAIALREALAAMQATIQFPAYPGVELDEQILVLDLGTGLVSRMAVESINSSFVKGEQGGTYTMTVGGPLIDTEDIAEMVTIIQNAVPRSEA